MKVCIDCPQLIPNGTRCPNCARARDRARGYAETRGYGHAHRRLRSRYQQRMNRGEQFRCWRCEEPIDPGRWALGHDDWDRTVYRGPECAACNYATSSRRKS